MKKLLLIAAVGLLGGVLRAQTAPSGYCGTLQTESDLTWLRNYQATYVPGELERGGTTYYIPTKVHIVGTDDGSGYYNLSYLYQSFCELNEHYAETGFIFYIYGDLNYVDNTDYYEHDWFDGSNMMEDYNVTNLLNVYFVSDPAGNCGYFSPSDDGVAVAKSCAMPGGTTIAHEFGHFFSLPHTFYGWEWGTPDDNDQEWVNGANCHSAADGFCDTPPDYLPYRWNCPGPLQTDPHGETFYSDGTFYMSYSNDACTDKFSAEQQDAMISNLLGPRNNFLDYPTPAYADLTEASTLITPEDAAINQFSNYLVFEWTPVTGATQYHLQLAYNASFSAIAKDVVTTNTFYEATDLQMDKKYYWRVCPLAPANTCASPSNARSFTTGTELNSVANSEIFDHLAVYPNPALVGQNLTMEYRSAESFRADISLLDMTGRELTSTNYQINQGNNTLDVAVPAVSSGMYILRITAENRIETISVMIRN